MLATIFILQNTLCIVDYEWVSRQNMQLFWKYLVYSSTHKSMGQYS